MRLFETDKKFCKICEQNEIYYIFRYAIVNKSATDRNIPITNRIIPIKKKESLTKILLMYIEVSVHCFSMRNPTLEYRIVLEKYNYLLLMAGLSLLRFC